MYYNYEKKKSIFYFTFLVSKPIWPISNDRIGVSYKCSNRSRPIKTEPAEKKKEPVKPNSTTCDFPIEDEIYICAKYFQIKKKKLFQIITFSASSLFHVWSTILIFPYRIGLLAVSVVFFFFNHSKWHLVITTSIAISARFFFFFVIREKMKYYRTSSIPVCAIMV